MEALIDPRTGPFSPIDDIKAELEEIRRMPAGTNRDWAIQTMELWLRRRQEDQANA